MKNLFHNQHFVDSPFPTKRGGGGVEGGFWNFPGRFCRLFIISLALEEWIPKQLKQVSIVSKKATATDLK